jgi:hypothetical protein
MRDEQRCRRNKKAPASIGYRLGPGLQARREIKAGWDSLATLQFQITYNRESNHGFYERNRYKRNRYK